MSIWELPFEGATLRGESKGSGPGLVFLHAGVADRRSWTVLQNELSSTHRTVAYDRRGFGDTTYVAGSFSHLDDLVAVLDHEGINEVSLVGNSMGGGLALDFALAHPERTHSLVLIGTAVSGVPPVETLSAPVQALDEALDAADEAGDLTEVNRLEAWLWLDGPAEPEGRIGGSLRELFLAMNGRALEASDPGQERERPPAFDRLGGLDVRTLVMVGSLDLPLMVDRSKLIAGILPRSEYVPLEDVAHLPALEQPDLVIPILRDFLAHG